MAKLTSTDIYGSLYIQGATASESTLSATQFTSTIATGTAPLIVASTTLVTNLNADLLDGQQGTHYLDYNNFTNIPTSLKNPNALTIAGGLSLSSGTTYDGSAAVTLSHADTSSASSLTALTGANVVSDIDVDAYGHVTTMATRTMTLADLGYTGSTTADNYSSWTLQALNNAGTSLGSSAITSGDIAQFQAGTNVTLAWADDKITISSANTTYSAGTGLSLSGTTFNHSNAVTAGTASGSSGTVNFGGTVTIPSITYDAQGHITSKGTTTITLPTPTYTVDTDSYISSATFATDTGILSLTRTGDVPGTVTVDLDGRYLLSSSFVNNYITGYTWTNGTTTGPTATITRNGLSNLNVSAFPSASATISGVITTGTQTFAGQKTFSNDVIISGNLTVDGTTTTINATNISVDDKNIELGAVTTPTDITADGGGITLKGTTDKTITWLDADDSWHFNQGITLDGVNLIFGTANQRNALDLNNNKIIGVDSLALSDSGPDGSITMGTWSIWNSPNDLTTNSDGNFQFVTGGVRKATINTSGQLELPVATGTSPMLIASTTMVSNLNVDYLDSQHGSYYLDYNNFTNKPTIGNGTLTMNTSGSGISGTATFTANQTGNTTFTVTSNATSANTASTIVARDASGNFTAGEVTTTKVKVETWTIEKDATTNALKFIF